MVAHNMEATTKLGGEILYSLRMLKGDLVIMPKQSFLELLDHLSEPHGHPGLANRLRDLVLAENDEEFKAAMSG